MSVHALDRPGTGTFAIEPVLGWRVWRLHRVEGRLTIVSATRNHTWPPAEALEATCWIDHGASGVPQPGCSCGIYAASTPSTLTAANVISSETCVVGAIAMWGSVVEHSRGARSQFAYPARLRLVCGRCLAAGGGAVAPARAREWEGVVTAVCERHAGGFLTTREATDVQQELLSTYVVDLLPIERLQCAFAPAPRARRRPLRSVGQTLAGVMFGGVGPRSAAVWSPRPKARDRRTGT
jgi:hypothetical protein